MAYFDNAATTFPKPKEVYDFMNEFYRNCAGNSGRGNYSQAMNSAALTEETRKLILNLLHAPSRQVVFTSSATIALNMIIQGVIVNALGCEIPLAQRNEARRGGTRETQNGLLETMTNEKFTVYISPFEHNAVTRVLNAYKNFVTIKILPVSKQLDYDFEKMRKDFENEAPNLVIVSHASNVFGFISPVEEIFSLAKKYGAITVLDMAQTAGLVDIPLANEIFDFAVFAGHKTLYGPTGIGGFVMKKEFALPAILFGGTGFESENQKMPESLPERFEAGTQNILGIAGLNAALKWIAKIGVNEFYRQEIKNRAILIEMFKKYDYIDIVGNVDNKNYVGIIPILFDSSLGIASDNAGNIFAERGISVRSGLQCAPLAHKFLGTMPAGTVRFSGSWFTKDEDFENLDAVLRNIEEEL
ncbi:MAG: aminotransferase class V-fold PLP-dependent enzyme [Treponema sp.]|nr:aminotransferase class V-fold PLP-dependent enzyme [Treponema sp.]